jgi:mannose-6-phosphate isomerase-like protein (cupin superfamily)/AraC-like DNA-binding protein
MDHALTEREQKNYLAVFRTKHNQLNSAVYSSDNAIHVLQFVDVHCKTSNKGGVAHRQWCDEITFVYSGEGEFIHNSTKHTIKSGQIHLCFQDDWHQVLPSKNSPLRFYCLGFSVDEPNPLCQALQKAKAEIEKTGNPVLSDCLGLLPAFQTVMAATYSAECDPLSEAAVSNTLNYIIYTVVSGFLGKALAQTDNISMKDSLLFNVVSYLKNNVYNMDALQKLPEDMGYSYSYLSHIFSDRMGQSLKEFFAALRARRFLRIVLRQFSASFNVSSRSSGSGS